MLNKTEERIIQAVWSQYLQDILKSEPEWSTIIFIVVMVLIFVVSVIGNLISCIVICFDRSMHTATNYYLLNLAVSDLIVTFGIWLEIHEHTSDSYAFGSVACKVHFFMVVLLWNNSILTMTALAIERYIAIWHPLMLKSSAVWRRVLKIILVIWALAVIETVPEMWSVDLVKSKTSSVCFTVPTPFARALNGILALVTFVIPLGIMMFFYAMIAIKVSRMEAKTKRDKIFNHRDNRSKVNKLIVALTLSFVVCWLPFFTVRLLYFLYDMQQLMRLRHWFGLLYKLVAINSWFGMVLNPVLFSLKSNKFRKALKALWATKCNKRRSPSPFELQHTQTIA